LNHKTDAARFLPAGWPPSAPPPAAWRRIFRPAVACKPGEVCAIPQVRSTYILIFWIVTALVLVALAFP